MKYMMCFLSAVLSLSNCYSQEVPMPQLDSACLDDLLIQRHSGRSYDATKSVTEEQIHAIVEAARLAPSCFNDQPWRFLICNRQTNPQAYGKVLESLVEFNQNWAKPASVLVVVVAHHRFTKNDNPNRWGPYDSGAAAFAMMLKATSLGLMAHQMGGFDENKIQQDFNIPADYTPMAVMAIGYESEEEANQPHEKDRRPIPANFFDGKWETGLNF